MEPGAPTPRGGEREVGDGKWTGVEVEYSTYVEM
jgi:hypothetical protein